MGRIKLPKIRLTSHLNAILENIANEIRLFAITSTRLIKFL